MSTGKSEKQVRPAAAILADGKENGSPMKNERYRPSEKKKTQENEGIRKSLDLQMGEMSETEDGFSVTANGTIRKDRK